MTRIEYGPKNAATGKHSLQEVARFSTDQLKTIGNQVTNYLATNPSTSRAEAVAELSDYNHKVFNRMEAGLDVLNQLTAIGRSIEDVTGEVVIKRDPMSSVLGVPDAKHSYYDLDLAPIPTKKEPQPKPPKRRNTGDKQQPIPEPTPSSAVVPDVTSEYKRSRPSRSERARRREERLLIEERDALETLIIDKGRESAERSIERNIIQITLGENGNATIYYEHPFKLGPNKTVPVNRETGAFIEEDDKFESFFKMSLKPGVLRYCEVIAQELEGKTQELEGKTPEPYKPEDLRVDPKDIFDRAVKAGVIEYDNTSGEGVDFFFQAYLFYLQKGYEIDLEKQVVKANPNSLFNTHDRPIHPQFAEFLKAKKAELESQKKS